MVSGPDFKNLFNPINEKPSAAQGAILRLAGLVEEKADIADAVKSLRELDVKYEDLPRTERLSLWGAAQTLFKQNGTDSSCQVLKSVGIEANPENVGKVLIVTFPWSGSSNHALEKPLAFDPLDKIKASFSFFVDRNIETTLRREFGLDGVRSYVPSEDFSNSAFVFKLEIDPHLTDTQKNDLAVAINNAGKRLPRINHLDLKIGENVTEDHPTKFDLMLRLKEQYPELFKYSKRGDYPLDSGDGTGEEFRKEFVFMQRLREMNPDILDLIPKKPLFTDDSGTPQDPPRKELDSKYTKSFMTDELREKLDRISRSLHLFPPKKD